MITNERQYKTTRRQLEDVESAMSELGLRLAESEDALTRISLEALASEADVLRNQLFEYEALKAGSRASLVVSDLSDLPLALIRARISSGMSQRDLASRLGLQEQQIQRYEATEYGTANLRRLREVAAAVKLELSPGFESAEAELIEEETSAKLDWSKFPVAEMYRRHWFDGFDGTLAGARQAADSLVKDYIEAICVRPAVALHRKHVRSGSELDGYALLAWECRILDLAGAVPLGKPYSEGAINEELISRLVTASRLEDGPLQAVDILAEIGIPLVIEPHLLGTHLDGASLLRDETPVIGLTLRYDRIDNFWFVLLHELGHVADHLRKGKLTSTFDDLDSGGGDRIEQEADSFAAEGLIPSAAWEHALARYVRSADSVNEFAEELGISPAIVAGRIRREADNYVMLSELVGTGQVRRLFENVQFGA